MKQKVQVAAVMLMLLFFWPPDQALAVYDDFSGPFISSDKWMETEFVREIAAGKLISKVSNSDTGGARNRTGFQHPELINIIECELTAVEINLDTGDNLQSFLSVDGFFYNTAGSGGPAGEIWAGLYIGDRGNGLESWWEVWEALDDDLDKWEKVGKDILIEPGILNYDTAYNARISYDGDNGLFFAFDENDHSMQGPPRQRDSMIQNKSLSSGIDANEGTGQGFVHGLFDNVFINGGPYDTFDKAPLNPDRWVHKEFVREIANGKLRLNIQVGGGGTVRNNTTLSEIPDYLEAKVLVQSTSFMDGARGDIRLTGSNFYNVERGPGSGQDYDGRLGDVFASTNIGLSPEGTLSAWVNVWKFDHPNDPDKGTVEYYDDFSTDIDFDTYYILSIHYTGSQIIFRCNEEILTYEVPDNVYPPYNDFRSVQLRYRDWGDGSGYIKTNVDYLATSYRKNLPGVLMLLLDDEE